MNASTLASFPSVSIILHSVATHITLCNSSLKHKNPILIKVLHIAIGTEVVRLQCAAQHSLPSSAIITVQNPSLHIFSFDHFKSTLFVKAKGLEKRSIAQAKDVTNTRSLAVLVLQQQAVFLPVMSHHFKHISLELCPPIQQTEHLSVPPLLHNIRKFHFARYEKTKGNDETPSFLSYFS